ncbi:hypothetical protein Pse7367_3101 [Thalassoporum mexicanum PCC 7367]|uniref:hypothetical protein n=1 Tax=Thalassoporum mexicanum TaxID=3457544 RepID=UPI00029FE693|nr:hypothetical protein [Pseudanabaena sp. PCC 7367]AFY71350.1 hypothetical protein Pse7367_3101 [Pseudanabaena sp. PCC 7367]
MQFIDAKQAYPLVLGVALALIGVAIWQRFSPPPTPQTIEPRVVIPPLPSSIPRPSPASGISEGLLRVGNRSDFSVRVVLLASRGNEVDWNQVEPLNWDFAPNEGGSEGLILSLPGEQVKIAEGDIVFAFATDGSRTYWGPNVVGETDAPFWDSDRQEWSMILQP